MKITLPLKQRVRRLLLEGIGSHYKQVQDYTGDSGGYVVWIPNNEFIYFNEDAEPREHHPHKLCLADKTLIRTATRVHKCIDKFMHSVTRNEYEATD